MITLKTSLGDIVLELNREKAPATVKNFEDYVDEGFYDGTLFHRVISVWLYDSRRRNGYKFSAKRYS